MAIPALRTVGCLETFKTLKLSLLRDSFKVLKKEPIQCHLHTSGVCVRTIFDDRILYFLFSNNLSATVADVFLRSNCENYAYSSGNLGSATRQEKYR